MYIVNSSKKTPHGSSRSFAHDPIKAGQLPKADFPASLFDIEPIDVTPGPSRSSSAAHERVPTQAAKTAQRARATRADPLRLIGAATLGACAVYAVLWSLGALFTTVGQSELQQFNAGRPVMLCTAGGYQAVDDSLIGRVFGERHFACRDWKMGL